MGKFFQYVVIAILVVLLGLGVVLVWGHFDLKAPTGDQKLVGTGLCGTKPAPVLPWAPLNTTIMFTTTKFFMNNPDSVGNITIDKVLIIKGDETVVKELTADQISTPVGEDNILTPHEIWEIDLMTQMDPTEMYAMYTLEVFWHAAEDCSQLTGYGLQLLIFIDGTDTILELEASQARMVNVLQVL